MEMTPATASVAGLIDLEFLGLGRVDPGTIDVELPVVVCHLYVLSNAWDAAPFYFAQARSWPRPVAIRRRAADGGVRARRDDPAAGHPAGLAAYTVLVRNFATRRDGGGIPISLAGGPDGPGAPQMHMASLGTFVPAAVLRGCIALLASLCPAAGPGRSAASAEYNPVRCARCPWGPRRTGCWSAFESPPENAVTDTVNARLRAQRAAASRSRAPAQRMRPAAARRAGLAIARSRQITPSMHVLFLPKTLYGADVEAVLAKLRADPAVQFAVVDQRRYPLAVTPDDPLFAPTPSASGPASGQWYMDTPSSTVITLEGNPTMDLSATDAVSAWGITTGSDGHRDRRRGYRRALRSSRPAARGLRRPPAAGLRLRGRGLRSEQRRRARHVSDRERRRRLGSRSVRSRRLDQHAPTRRTRCSRTTPSHRAPGTARGWWA